MINPAAAVAACRNPSSTFPEVVGWKPEFKIFKNGREQDVRKFLRGVRHGSGRGLRSHRSGSLLSKTLGDTSNMAPNYVLKIWSVRLDNAAH